MKKECGIIFKSKNQLDLRDNLNLDREKSIHLITERNYLK